MIASKHHQGWLACHECQASHFLGALLGWLAGTHPFRGVPCHPCTPQTNQYNECTICKRRGGALLLAAERGAPPTNRLCKQQRKALCKHKGFANKRSLCDDECKTR